jgi:hypothetical protein
VLIASVVCLVEVNSVASEEFEMQFLSNKNWTNRLRAIALNSLVGGLISAIGIIPITSSAASAQAAYGSYVGVGPSFGLSSGDDSESSNAAVIAVRYRLLELPISLRAQALVFGDTPALVPTVSYDIPLNWQTDAYIGAGVVLQDGGEGNASPLGNQTSFVIQPGVDYSLPYSDLVIFGNAIIAFDAYRDGGGTAASLQGGVGLRF